MAIHIREVLPLLETIYKQQVHISDRLTGLKDALSAEPTPIEPHLRAMLKPLLQDILEMQQVLSLSEDSPGS
jgi:hypothetical protein